MRDRTGLPPVGELEGAVLRHLWSEGAADVKAVYNALGRERGITLNTVQSAMERLYRKGLLKREKVSHAYVYSTSLSPEEFGSRAVSGLLSEVMHGRTDSILSAFVDFAARTGEDTLDRLERLINERRAALGDEKDGR